MKLEHKNSKAARRGPMDEMRQLVRILVKLMPESSRFLTVPDEGGGGNRVKEEHIKDYLNKVLGRSQDLRDDAPPYPDWGLMNGWAAYLSELFTWARGAPITPDQALRCARRLPGRSWETITEELEKLRLCPQAWPLPLRKESVRDVQKRYEETGQLPPVAPRPSPAMQIATAFAPQLVLVDTSAMAGGAGAAAGGPGDLAQFNGREGQLGAKRPLGGDLSEEVAAQQQTGAPPPPPPQQQQTGATTIQVAGGPGGQALYAQIAAVPPFAQHAAAAGLPASATAWAPQPPAAKRRKKPGSGASDFGNLSDYSELELWHLALKVLQESEFKRNTTPANRLGDLQNTHDMVRRIVDSFTPGANGSGAAGHGMPAPIMLPPPASYHPQVQGGQVAAPAAPATAATAPGAGAPPAMVTVAAGSAAGSAAAAAPVSGMDAATQLRARLMVLPQAPMAGPQGGHVVQVLSSHGLAGHQLGAGTTAWPKPPTAQNQHQQQQQQQQQQQSATAAPPATSAVAPQSQSAQAPLSSGPAPAQAASSLTTIQQPAAPNPTPAYPAPCSTPAAPQPPAQQTQPSQQATPPPPPPQPPPPPPPQQPQHHPPQQLAGAPMPAPAVAAAGATGGSQGAGAVTGKSAAPSDPGLRALAGKEAARDAAGRTGDVRLGSSAGAFQRYDNHKVSDKFENTMYDKGSGGLEALAAAAAELGERCGGQQDDEDGRQRAISPTAAPPALPPAAHGLQPHAAHQHSARTTAADNQHAASRVCSAPPGPRHHHTQEYRRPEQSKVAVRGATAAALEEMDETEARVPLHHFHSICPAESTEVDGPTGGPQPASSIALPRSAKELRTRVHLQMERAAQDVEEAPQQHPHQHPHQQHDMQHQPQAHQSQLQHHHQQQHQPAQHPSIATPQHQTPQPQAQQQQQQQQQHQQQQQQPSGVSAPAASGGHVGTESVSPTTALAVALPQPLSAVQPGPGQGGAQTLVYHLLQPMDGLTALAHRGLVPVPYPAQLGLGQQIINTGQQYVLVTGQVPPLVTSQVQGQYVLAAPATATLSAGVSIGVSSPAVLQQQ